MEINIVGAEHRSIKQKRIRARIDVCTSLEVWRKSSQKALPVSKVGENIKGFTWHNIWSQRRPIGMVCRWIVWDLSAAFRQQKLIPVVRWK